RKQGSLTPSTSNERAAEEEITSTEERTAGRLNHHYNLRPRKKVTYADQTTSKMTTMSLFVTVICALTTMGFDFTLANCTLCSALLFNPECWPMGAILATALLFYLLITGCYVFLYVPVVIGKPVRVAAKAIYYAISWIGTTIRNRKSKTRTKKALDLVELLAIVMTLAIITSTVQGCQQIDIFAHQSTVAAFDYKNNERRKWTIQMLPNVPVKRSAFSLTLSSINVPPTPLLNTPFITDGQNIALWDSRLAPALLCDNSSAALNLDCEFRDNCACYSAETKANCKCENIDLDTWFSNLQHRLPVITPSVSFKKDPQGGIRATMTTRTTSEIILTIQDQVETEVIVKDDICVVSNAPLTGCYKCAKGAEASIVCKSSKPTQAEIRCEGSTFTVQCDSHGVPSILHFSFAKARIGLTCTVSCGRVESTFRIGGVLKFTHSAQTLMYSSMLQLTISRI
ncbi:hypothetical protein OSTOST_17207, partial [Ostertagia ostertagi]